MYEEFVRRNPTFENRVDALTSGLLSPDTKALALWAMKRDKDYRATEFYSEVQEFTGGSFPLTMTPVWQYCSGNPTKNLKGPFNSIGVVDEHFVADQKYSSVLAYSKTRAGADFGEPLAALACTVVNKLDASPNRPKKVSMLRTLGQFNSVHNMAYGHGYTVYKIIKLLAEYPDQDFRCIDITERTHIDRVAISSALNTLGRNGIIYYYSPARDVGGKRSSGWSVKTVKKEILEADFGTIYQQAYEEGLRNRSDFLRVFDYCRSHIGEEVEYNKVSSDLRINSDVAMKCINKLANFGYLKWQFKSRKKLSYTKCNEHTVMLWKDFFYDVEKIASNVEVYPNLGRSLDLYRNDDLRREHVRRWMQIYEDERTQKGPGHGKVLRGEVFEAIGGTEKKLSHIHEILAGRGLDMSRRNLLKIIKKFEESGQVTRVKKGYYKLAG